MCVPTIIITYCAAQKKKKRRVVGTRYYPASFTAFQALLALQWFLPMNPELSLGSCAPVPLQWYRKDERRVCCHCRHWLHGKNERNRIGTIRRKALIQKHWSTDISAQAEGTATCPCCPPPPFMLFYGEQGEVGKLLLVNWTLLRIQATEDKPVALA